MNRRIFHETGPLISIGYGNRPWTEFIALLKRYDIRYMADVRSHPVSRRKEFDRTSLKTLLIEENIRYIFLGDRLGGRPADADCYTDGYVDYELCGRKGFFREGIERLKTAHTGNHRTAVMCSETSPELCHRSKLVGQALADEGIILWHIDRDGSAIAQKEVIDRLPREPDSLFGKRSYRSDGQYLRRKSEGEIPPES